MEKWIASIENINRAILLKHQDCWLRSEEPSKNKNSENTENTPPDIGSHRDMTRFGRGRCHCVKEVYHAVHDFYLYFREGILALEGCAVSDCPQRPVMVILAQSAVSMSVWVC